VLLALGFTLRSCCTSGLAALVALGFALGNKWTTSTATVGNYGYLIWYLLFIDHIKNTQNHQSSDSVVVGSSKMNHGH
jgi:hypothetical protein